MSKFTPRIRLESTNR